MAYYCHPRYWNTAVIINGNRLHLTRSELIAWRASTGRFAITPTSVRAYNEGVEEAALAWQDNAPPLAEALREMLIRHAA